MATRRIKEITNTATTFASDDFIALDGTSQGTRKMDKDDLISQVSAGVSGDYLEEANNLSDVASLDTSKLNLEVPDVGTAPDETPLNQHLGSMAYQSADSVSMGKAEIESTTGTATTQALTVTDGTDTNFVVQEDGRVAISQSSPGSFNAAADDLVIGDGTGDRGLTIATATNKSGGLYFADGTSGDDRSRGYLSYNHYFNALRFGVNAATQWEIGSSGNLVAYAAGVGIDFGSGASTTIDSYEHGDITSVTDASGASLAITADMKYQVIGKSVQISGKITFPTTTDTRAARVTLLPEQCPNADGARGLSVSYTTSGSGLYVMPVGNTNDVMFWNLSGTSQQNSNLSGLTIFISGNYSLN